ncbi:flavin monoamine oxidase family protein [Streptomyces clavuligerus]|uniref:flavin monoamine oxidase family protein n=1 Tax=Streptomyces clavuligerus TaxID=1901 RepID=UPI000180039F|nr:NAD(P)/FAD-dependent oxidoreductase [Streptomyces clavuligerus]ANW22486.1 amine oxidase [Streptomyces clavuligerus]AXU17004.1 FAD-dependent oxidoreductase [Streptomyces clavuligerus]EDY52819.1 L-amino acid oxidase [Streptomyces clavuligerus]MBY6306949.1 FAD-dependent oxidoreductase [Streptomyces clavuligerus]QCS10465.1 FAD-dependent oxidoreductase [Streptomyces clavuligerus]
MTVSPREIDGPDGAVAAPKKVTVIGAGIAGLVAAYELERLGHQVQIIEGSQEVGGRIHTHHFAGRGRNGPFAELGAMRIPSAHRLTLHYIAELGLQNQVHEFRTLFSDDAAYLATSGGYLRVREAHRTLVAEFAARLPHRNYRDDTLLFGAWLDASIRAIAPRHFCAGLSGDTGVELLDFVDRVDVTPYRCGGAENRIDLHAFFADHPRARSICPPRLERFLDDVLDETSSTIVRLRGGMEALPRRLAARIRGRITTGQEVVGIHVRDESVLLRLRQGTKVTSLDCDYVVCTIPFPVLRRMRLTGFDQEKLDIVRQTAYWGATKLAFHCREPFWEKDGISGGASFTGGHVRQTYYPPAEGDPALGAVLLASYSIGPDADALSRLSEAERVAVVTRELSVIHPELRRPGMVLGVAGRDWGTHRWSRGAATVRWGQEAVLREAERREAARPQRGLHFAGEHCSSKPAWIEGAIESAIDVAHGIEWYEPRTARRVLATTRPARSNGPV